MADTYDLALQRLALSGLTEIDYEILGLQALTATETKALHPSFLKVPSIKIRYWDPLDKNKLLSSWDKHPGFYRLRYLVDEEQKAVKNKDGKDIRYTNEPGAGVSAYFPRSIDWPAVFNNPEMPIVITEGEIKAAAACAKGVPTIGLGGVYSFKVTHLGINMLPELKKINWVRRSVYIVYDSDFRSNPNVLTAINQLAEELMQAGAYPNFTSLPDEDQEGKVGLDDFLVLNPEIDLADMLLVKSQPLTQARKLHQFNNDVVYVRQPGLVLVQDTHQKITPPNFVSHAYSNLDYAELIIASADKVSLKRTNIAQAWINWPHRFEVDRLTYSPGQEKFLKGKTGGKYWNVWQGWGCKPEPGDVSPFLLLIDHLFTGADEAGKEWLLDWLAYPLQYPGTKLFTSVLMWGLRHGTGKSLVGYTMKEIYGVNFAEIDQEDLHGSFNEWAEAKQFVMGDDVAGSDKRQDNDKLKKMITQNELRVNMKFMPTYVVPDCINYFFTSNHPDSFFLEDDDRRSFIHEVTVRPKSADFYADYMLWLATGGSEAVFDWLLKRDVSRFNPAAPAYITAAKTQMINDVKSDLGTWCRRLLEMPDEMLVVGGVALERDLYTAKDLHNLYDPEGRTRVTQSGLARELRRCSVRQVAGGKLISTRTGPDRYFAIRNPERWEKASYDELCLHLDPSYAPKNLGKIAARGKKKY